MKKTDKKCKSIIWFTVWEGSSTDTLTARKMNQLVLDQIKPENITGDKKITKQKLSYLEHIMKSQDSLGRTTMLRKMKGRRKRGKPNMTWTDSIKEAMG